MGQAWNCLRKKAGVEVVISGGEGEWSRKDILLISEFKACPYSPYTPYSPYSPYSHYSYYSHTSPTTLTHFEF